MAISNYLTLLWQFMPFYAMLDHKAKPKLEKNYHWGSKLLPKVAKGKGKKKTSPGQMRLPWDDWEVVDSEVSKVAEEFVMANCYDPEIAAQFFDDA